MGYFLKNVVLAYQVSNEVSEFKDLPEYKDLFEDITQLYPRISKVVEWGVNYFELPSGATIIVYKVLLFITATSGDEELITKVLNKFETSAKELFTRFFESQDMLTSLSSVL